jgi:molecular chaperone DnaK
MSKRAGLVGIDLGTSYSSIALLDPQGFARTILNDRGQAATPSVVYFANDEPIVGTRAEKAYLKYPDRVIYNAKRYLGRDGWSWEIDGVEYTPVDVAAIILRQLRRDAERQLGRLGPAVICVPAHFNTHQRALTVEAAEQAGIEVLEIINEPVAAALCYILGEEGVAFAGLAERQRVMVYDLGGGTFDLSLVDYDEQSIRVLCANGELKLGGIDWNQRLIDEIADKALKKFRVDPRVPQHRRMFAELATAVEAAKRQLSVTEDEVPIRFRIQKRAATSRIDRQGFELLTGDLLDRTRMLVEQLRETSQLGWHEIDSVLLVGGSSRMPMVRRMILKLVGGMRIKQIDPELSVAHGAALYAGIIGSGQGHDSMSQGARRRLGRFDTEQVNTLTLGMIVVDEQGQRVVHPLIPRDTPLPATARVSVATTVANQRRVSLKILEEGADVEICRCVIDQLPPRLPSGSRFDVDLTYNPGGLLQVTAQHESGLLATVNVSHVPVPLAEAVLDE